MILQSCLFYAFLEYLYNTVSVCFKYSTIIWYSKHAKNLAPWMKTSLVWHLPRVYGVQNSPNKLSLDPVILTYDLWTWPWPLWPSPSWPWPLTTFSETRLKIGLFTFLTLTFDLWHWPSNLSEIFPNVCAKFYVHWSIGSACRLQTGRQTDTRTPPIILPLMWEVNIVPLKSQWLYYTVPLGLPNWVYLGLANPREPLSQNKGGTRVLKKVRLLPALIRTEIFKFQSSAKKPTIALLYPMNISPPPLWIAIYWNTLLTHSCCFIKSSISLDSTGKHALSAMLLLASCPWGPVTANGVDLLTEINAIYMEARTSHRAIARCFGLGHLSNLAPCQPHWQLANTWKPV